MQGIIKMPQPISDKETGKKKLSHEEVEQRMHLFLYTKLTRYDSRNPWKDDEFRAVIGEQEFAIIAPVRELKAPSLENRIQKNSKEGIATVCVFPKSSSAYDGNYPRLAGRQNFSMGGEKRWHNHADLSTAERYLIRTFGNDITYFNPQDPFSIESMWFKKEPDWFIAGVLGIHHNPKWGAAVREYIAALREYYGAEQKVARKLEPADFRQLWADDKFRDVKDRLREKFSRGVIVDGKSLYTLEVIEKGRLYIAKLVGVKPLNASSQQGKQIDLL